VPDTPPPSPLTSPDFRRRLQQRYEEAARLAAQQPCDHARVHELLADCVRSDPGSILYLDALLANLRSWQPKRPRSWWPKWITIGARNGGIGSVPEQTNKAENVPGTAVLSTKYAVLRAAPEALLPGRDDPEVLNQLATAAGACDFEQVELRYLTAARDAAPDDSQAQRLLARAMTRQGRFEEAAAVWKSVLPLATDSEVAQAVDDLRTDEKLSSAERDLDRAQAASGGSLSRMQEREELRLASSQQRITIARLRAAHDTHPKAQSLVGRFEAEHLRLETEILHLRSERLPGDWKIRVELARRLKLAGNYSGAIQRLEEANRLQPEEPEILVELGECWQHLRQFAKALDYYHQAVGRAAVEGEMRTASESLVLARYRAGVLLAAMGRPDEALAHFTGVVAADPGYKDAQQRLDKLRAS
jgi:tetratricopeptide (TPR) repeat protein